MKELITLQFGPLANYAGAHLWSMQDEWAANRDGAAAAAGDAEFERDVMLRQSRTRDGRAEFRVPRLVLVERQGELGVVGQRGLQFAAPFAGELDEAVVASAGQTWGGRLHVSEVDIFAPHPFVAQLRRVGEEGGEEAWGEEEGEAEPEAESEAAPAADADDDAADARAGGGFAFGRTVCHWSDYLQLDIHPRSVHELKDFAHGYSGLDQFAHGADLLSGALGGAEARERAEALLDAVRRELEDADCAQGLLVLADADTAYGGLAHGTLLAVNDELGRVGSLCFGLGEAAEPRPGATGADEVEEGASAPHPPRLDASVVSNRARALAALTESAGLYVPLVAPADGAAGGLPAGALDSRFSRAAALSVAIDGLSAPCRALHSAQHRPLPWLTSAASVTDATRLCAASALFPVVSWQPAPSGAWADGVPLCPLLPPSARAGARAQLPPASHLLVARGCEALRAPEGAGGGAAQDERAPPAEREWRAQRQEAAWWAAPAAAAGRCRALRLRTPLELPLSFPQRLFAAEARAALGGGARGAPRELHAIPTLCRLENSPLLSLGVRAAERELRAELRAAASSGGAGGDGADSGELLHEACERLAQLADDYAGCAQAGADDLLELEE